MRCATVVLVALVNSISSFMNATLCVDILFELKYALRSRTFILINDIVYAIVILYVS